MSRLLNDASLTHLFSQYPFDLISSEETSTDNSAILVVEEVYSDNPYPVWRGVYPPNEIGRIDGDFVEFIIDSVRYTAKIEADGKWEFALPMKLDDGPHVVTYRYYDKAQNSGPARQLILHIDTTAPEQPVILFAEDDASGIGMPIYSGAQTADTKPKIVGNAEPGSTVIIWEGSVMLGSTKASASGHFELEVELGTGDHTFYVTAADRFGYTSTPSENFVLHIGAPAPLLPPVLEEVYDDVGPVQGKLSLDSVTDDHTPTFSGTAGAGVTSVNIYDHGKLVANVNVINGQWRWEGNFSEGKHSVSLASVNAKGELSQPTDAFTFSVDDTNGVRPGEYIWDFNDGTLQGWTANDKYAKNLHNENKSIVTHGPDSNGANEVMYNYIDVVAGRSYWFHFQAWDPRSGAGSTATMGMKVDGKTIINPGAFTNNFKAGNSLVEYGGEYVATETKRVRISITNSSYNVGFRVDNISVKTLPFVPKINEFEDNDGKDAGVFKSGSITDDATPILHGKSLPDSILYLQSRSENGTWQDLGSVRVDHDGTWRFEAHNITHAGDWQYRAKFEAAADEKFWSQPLNLHYQPVIPTITGYLDDEGKVKGELKVNTTTDDATPELHGEARPNSIIHLQSSFGGNIWQDIGSVKVGSDGKWSFQADNITHEGNWLYRVQATSPIGETLVSETFHLEYLPALPTTDFEYVWNFDDGTLQGWSAVGKYASSVEVGVDGSGDASHGNVLKTSIGDWDKTGYKGEVIYRNFDVVAGRTYEFSFESKGTRHKLGFTVDGKALINNVDNHNWTEQSGTYVATQSKTVLIAITNGNASGYWNDFFIDNVKVKVSADPSAVKSLSMMQAEEGDQHTTSISLSDVLADGERGLYLDDHKMQKLITGKAGDTVTLTVDDVAQGSWVKSTGEITVNGVEYTVYQHTQQEAELLIQQGINVLI